MLWDKIKTSPQYVLPQHWLSARAYSVTRWRWAPFKNFLIRVFVKIYRVDLQIAERKQAELYDSFNDFFTRSLQASARPVNADSQGLVSPVDGKVSQLGSIVNDQLLQAKSRYFSLNALLADDEELITRFSGGLFSTIYLSPTDYHRIHFPVTAELKRMIYVPGDLFSVNDSTTRAVDKLFARNERVICLFDTELGHMACILVGAIFVGGMETVWHGEITPARSRECQNWEYGDDEKQGCQYQKGEELGRFNMGSTVILLFEKDRVQWSQDFQVGSQVQMGQLIGTARPQKL